MTNKGKKIYIRLAVLAGLLLIFLLSLNYLASTVINMESIKDKLQATVSRKVGGEVTFQNIDLLILPFTHAVVHKTSISIPGRALGTIETLDVSPKILPLFTGKVLIDEIRIGSADINFTLPEKVAKKNAAKEPVANDPVKDRVAAVLASLASVAPELAVEISDVRISLTEEAASPVKDKKPALKGKYLKGTFYVDKDKTKVSLARLDLDYPRLSMSGELLIDGKTPAISLELKGEDLDVHSTREVALALGGDNSTVINIFDILRGGTIPEIIFNSSGTTMNDLGKTENIVVRGNLAKGNIHVPGVDLDLEEVKGDVKISEGILEGENLEARLENATGREGKLTIGLEGENAPFHLDLLVKANLMQMPPLLRRIVKNKAFINEITRIHNVKGNAEARLTLGESLKSINTGVDILEINLSADYERIPYPLSIEGGQLSYSDSAVSLSNLTGKVGQSSFSGLTASIDFANDPHLEILSGKSSIVLDELFTWLSSYENLKTSLKEINNLDGTLSLSSLNLKGPVSRPKDWLFQVAGDVRSLSVDTPLVPGQIKVTSGEFKANQETLSFKGSQVGAMDASFKMSGALDGYLEGLHKTDVTFNGAMGTESTKWISGIINLPPQFEVRSPLSASPAHLVWERGAMTSLRGNFVVRKSPHVSVDLLLKPENIAINNLSIKDKESNVSLELALTEKEMSFSFDGNITRTTLGNIFLSSSLQQEWIKGNFKARLLADEPMNSSAEGRLEGKNIILPLKLKEPLTINSLVLDASNNQINLESGDLTLGNSHFTMKGDISFSSDGYLLDLDAIADDINWDTLHTVFESEKDAEEREHFWDFPLKGKVSLRSDSFTFKQFKWTPLNADISLTPGKINVSVTEATACNISSPGELEVTPQYMSLDFKPAAVNQDLNPTTECLFGISRYMSGNFDLEGNVKAKGKSEEIVNALTGELQFKAGKGRIYHYGVLSKVLAFINVTEIFRGRLPDFTKEGFAYETINAKADIKGSTLSLKEAVIDGSSMGIATHGDFNLKDQTLDLEILVAPFKTADYVLEKIPLINTITGGTLVSIPVKVTGDARNPHISNPSVVGSGLLRIMKNTFEAPVKIFMPDKKEEEKENNDKNENKD